MAIKYAKYLVSNFIICNDKNETFTFKLLNQRRPNSLNSFQFKSISLSDIPMNKSSTVSLVVLSSPFLNSVCLFFVISRKSFSSIWFRISGSLIVAKTKVSFLFSGLSRTVYLKKFCFCFVLAARENEVFLSTIPFYNL